MNEITIICIASLLLNWYLWTDRGKQQNIIDNMKNGGDGVKITHNKTILFERKKGVKA